VARTVLRALAAAVAVSGIAGGARADARAAAAFVSLPLSVRQMGMGDAAPGGADVLRAWCNPALLADRDGLGEVAISGGAMPAGQMTGGLGVARGFGDTFSAGALVSYAAMSAPEVDSTGAEGADISHSVVSAGAVGAVRWKWLRAGLTVKLVSETLAKRSTSGFAIEPGVVARSGDVSVGASLRNMGIGPLEESGDVEAVLPSEFRVGAAYLFSGPRVAVVAEFVSPRYFASSMGGGVEWRPFESLALRVGAKSADGKVPLTAGFTAILGAFALDYAFSTHEIGMSNRVSVGYAFGARRASPAAAGTGPVAAPPPAARKPVASNFAVAELTAQGVSASDAAVIADMLRSELVKDGVRVIEKSNMDKILAEQAFQQTGCTSEECAVKIGKLLNVQAMVVGSFGKLMDKYFVNLRLVSVENGSVLFADSAKGRQVEDIEAGVKDLAKKIAKQAR